MEWHEGGCIGSRGRGLCAGAHDDCRHPADQSPVRYTQCRAALCPPHRACRAVCMCVCVCVYVCVCVCVCEVVVVVVVVVVIKGSRQ